MKSSAGGSASLVTELVKVVNTMLQQCSEVTLEIEDGILNWLEMQAATANLPIEQLQRLDYLRQVHMDLAALTAFIAKEQQREESEVVNCDSLSVTQSVILNETKLKISEAIKSRNHVSFRYDEDNHSGDVDFF